MVIGNIPEEIKLKIKDESIEQVRTFHCCGVKLEEGGMKVIEITNRIETTSKL